MDEDKIGNTFVPPPTGRPFHVVQTVGSAVFLAWSAFRVGQAGQGVPWGWVVLTIFWFIVMSGAAESFFKFNQKYAEWKKNEAARLARLGAEEEKRHEH